MSAWPEAIYIINKLNKALENTTTFQQDVPRINDTNRQINNLNIKIQNSGIVQETEEEYRNAKEIGDASEELTVYVTRDNLNKTILYSEMSLQDSNDIIYATINLPQGLLTLLNDQTRTCDFSYTIDENEEASIIYIFTDYERINNFPPEQLPILTKELDNYTLQTLITYLQAQDAYLDYITNSMNNTLTEFISNNNLDNLDNIINSVNSKLAIISEAAPVSTELNPLPLSDYTVWLHKEVDINE